MIELSRVIRNIPEHLNTFVLVGHGGIDLLEWHTDRQVSVPADTDVLIRVDVCGLHNTDINTRPGWYSKAVTEATSMMQSRAGD